VLLRRPRQLVAPFPALLNLCLGHSAAFAFLAWYFALSRTLPQATQPREAHHLSKVPHLEHFAAPMYVELPRALAAATLPVTV
jgi:hypothetical protein